MRTQSSDLGAASADNTRAASFWSDHAEPLMRAGEVLLASMPHMACIMRPDGEVLLANTGWRDVFPAFGHLWKEALHPVDRAALDELCAQYEHGEYPEIEARLRKPGEDWAWHMISLKRMRDPDGDDLNLYVMTAWSVDRYKQQHSALETDFVLQQKMLNASADCIKIVSPSGELKQMNQAGCLALGVDEESGFGMAWLSLLPPEVRDAGETALAAVRGGSSARFPGMSQLPDMPVAYWDNLLTPVLDEDGGVSEVVCISRDITSETLRAQELRVAQQGLQLSAEVARLGRFELRLADLNLMLDDFSAEYMGIAEAGDVHFEQEFLSAVHPEDQQQVAEAIRQSFGPLGERRFEFDFRSLSGPDGALRYLHAKGVTLFDGEQPWRLIGTLQDVTPDRLIRHQMQEARDQLAASLETEQILATEMHHRIKNLFTVMAGLISMSRREVRLNEEAATTLESLRQRVLAMARATDMIAKVSGRYVSRSSFDPQRVADAVLEPYTGQFEVQGNVTELPSHMLTPVVLLLHELATNSLKHGALLRPDGKVSVCWSATTEDIQMRWKETGGPEILEVPQHAGLGTGMLKGVVRLAGGDIHMDWPREGLCATVCFVRS